MGVGKGEEVGVGKGEEVGVGKGGGGERRRRWEYGRREGEFFWAHFRLRKFPNQLGQRSILLEATPP